jgi:hypothetical protein
MASILIGSTSTLGEKIAKGPFLFAEIEVKRRFSKVLSNVKLQSNACIWLLELSCISVRVRVGVKVGKI